MLKKILNVLLALLEAGKDRGLFSKKQGPDGPAKLVILALLILGVSSCGGQIQIPPCILDGSCLPKPSPSPVVSPSPSPTPTPTPLPSPSPSPEPSPSPSPLPSPSPSPEPSPRPSPSPCVGGLPEDPVPVVHDAPCPAGFVGSWGKDDSGADVHFCTAESTCKYDRCPAQWDPSAQCGNIHEAYHGGTTSPERPYGVICFNSGCYINQYGNGITDAYGRRYRGATEPSKWTYMSDWTWSGYCPPAAATATCPSPGPSPSPSPSPTPRPSPSPSPGPGGPMVLHQCPDWYPRQPDHVKVGHNTRPAPANKNAWLINFTPQMNEEVYCMDENGKSRGVPCEQWGGCVYQGLHDPNDPKSSWEPATYAEGPGFPWDHIEKRSREPEVNEPPCPPEDQHCYINYYLGNMVLGDGGSGPGLYHICAAPTEAEMADYKAGRPSPNVECWDFNLTLP